MNSKTDASASELSHADEGLGDRGHAGNTWTTEPGEQGIANPPDDELKPVKEDHEEVVSPVDQDNDDVDDAEDDDDDDAEDDDDDDAEDDDDDDAEDDENGADA
jgi:hypothetical protein